MRPLFTHDELTPGASVPGFSTPLTVIKHPAAGRLWALSSLLVPGWYLPDPRWCSETLLDVLTEDLPSDNMPSALALLPFPRTTPVFTALERAPTFAADWAFYLDHIVTNPFASVVAPPDLSWVLINHYSEFITVHRSDFSRIREIAFTESFPRHDGVAVPKPQYLVRFDDGTYWLSGDLRHPPHRTSYDGLLAAIADRAGLPVATLDILPEHLARPPRRQP